MTDPPTADAARERERERERGQSIGERERERERKRERERERERERQKEQNGEMKLMFKCMENSVLETFPRIGFCSHTLLYSE